MHHDVGTTVRSADSPAAAYCHAGDGGDAPDPASYGAPRTVPSPAIVHFRSSASFLSTPQPSSSFVPATENQGGRRTETGPWKASQESSVVCGAGFVAQDQRQGRNGKFVAWRARPRFGFRTSCRFLEQCCGIRAPDRTQSNAEDYSPLQPGGDRALGLIASASGLLFARRETLSNRAWRCGAGWIAALSSRRVAHLA
jgi:hypothetical protein